MCNAHIPNFVYQLLFYYDTLNAYILGLNEPVSSKKYMLACASIEDSDQPVHPHSLTRVFDWRSISCQVSSVSSDGKLRL